MHCRFLATGRSFKDMSFSFRLGVSTIREIVYDTCTALWEVLQPIYMQRPTEDIWRKNAEMFERMWNFPHCVAAIDGKHCFLQCPPRSGSKHFNWKHCFSIVLLAAVDATYKFIWVDMGRSGGSSDGGLFRCTAFGNKVLTNELGLPPDEKITKSYSATPMPYVMVGDEAFPLVRNIMRPYPGRKKNKLGPKKTIFNYRLSRARRLVESAFGILASRNRVFKSTSCMLPENYTKVILAATVMHNYLCGHLVTKMHARAEKQKLDEVKDDASKSAKAPCVLKDWRKVGYRAHPNAIAVRDEFTRHFYQEGQVRWQWKLPLLQNKKLPDLLYDAEV